MSGVEGGDDLGAEWRGRAGRRASGGERPGGVPYRQEVGAPFSFFDRIDGHGRPSEQYPSVRLT
jgi:hypothetical protein